MSLVNQVLKDLEKNPPSSSLKLQAVAEEKSVHSISKIFLIISAVIILLVSYHFWSLKYHQIESNSETLTNSLSHKPDQFIKESTILPDKAPGEQASSAELNNEKQEVTQTLEKENSNSSKEVKIEQKKELTASKIDNESHTQSLGKRETSDEEIKKFEVVQIAKSSKARKRQTESKAIKKISNESQLNIRLSQIIKDNSIFGAQHTFDSLSKLVSENPTFENARLQLIKLAWTQQRKQLKSILQEAITQSSEQSAFYVAFARYHLEESQTEEAFKVINKYKNIDQSAELLRFRALLHQKLGNHRAAVNDYQKVIQLASANDSTYLALGISLEAIGEIEHAKTSYRKALTGRSLNSQQLKFVENKLSSLQG